MFRLADDVPAAPASRRDHTPCVGHIVGRGCRDTRARHRRAARPDTSEDRLKALGAAAASSGAVAMFHAVGITPEAPTLEAALGGSACGARGRRHARASPRGPRRADDRRGWIHRRGERRHAASLRRRDRRARRARPAARTEGSVLCEHRSRRARRSRMRSGALSDAGVTVVTDTCTYITPHPARHRRSGDDQLGEMGVVRADEPRIRRGVRIAGGVRSLRVARPGVARPGTLWASMSESRTLVAGRASGIALVLDEPLSFWGGLDPGDRRR